MIKRIAVIILATMVAVQTATAAQCYPCFLCINVSSIDGIVANVQQQIVRQLINAVIDGDYFDAIDELQDIYDEHLAEINKQNELLKQYLAISKNQALKDKEIVFLKNKFNQIQNIENTLEGLK